MNKFEKGKKAEEVAARYLRARGYRIWKSNWRSGHRELDLVALYQNQLIIVEVKARDGNPVNEPSEVVDPVKQRNIVLATESFIRRYDCHYPTRFDVVAVIYHAGGFEIEHLENAFYAAVE